MAGPQIPFIPSVQPNNWGSVVDFNRMTQKAVSRLASMIVGSSASPTFSDLTLTDLTASRLVATGSTSSLDSVSNLASWIAGTANEIDIADDGDGTITVGLVNPLIVSKGGTGLATLTDHGILLGSGTDAITPLGVATNGQLPIGSTGADPVLAALSEGEGIDITNGAGTISIAGEDASDTNKGIASFNSTNFSVAVGVVNTTQDIDTTAAPQFAGGTFTDVVVGVTPTISSHLATKEYVDDAVTAINANYYLLDTASGISDYKDTSFEIPSEVEASDAHSVTADDQYLRGWISPTTPFISTLVAGVYNLYIEAKVSATSGAKRVKLYWKLVEYFADTSEVVIGTSEDGDELTTSQSDYNIHFVLPTDYTVTAGSRIVGKLYANLYGTGTNPTVTLYYLGSVLSRWSVPSSTEVLTSMFIPYSGAVDNVDLGSNNLITTGELTSGRFNVEGASTYIDIDGSGNMTFTDAVSGTKTLKQLGCPTYKYIKATTQSEGDLHLSDATYWGVSKALLYSVRVVTLSTNWDLYLIQNDNGFAANDANIPMLRIARTIIGNANLMLNIPYEDEDASDEVHMYWVDNSGTNTADFYIQGYELI